MKADKMYRIDNRLEQEVIQHGRERNNGKETEL